MNLCSYYDLNLTTKNPEGLMYLFQLVFAIYMLITTIVLINLLIAMMSDTYQRIQVGRHPQPSQPSPGGIRCGVEVWSLKAYKVTPFHKP